MPIASTPHIASRNFSRRWPDILLIHIITEFFILGYKINE
jgi:hypothetical protein